MQNEKQTERIIQYLRVTYEACSTQSPSPEGLAVMVDDLRGYTPRQILRALELCRKEVKGFLSLAHIIERIKIVIGEERHAGKIRETKMICIPHKDKKLGEEAEKARKEIIEKINKLKGKIHLNDDGKKDA